MNHKSILIGLILWTIVHQFCETPARAANRVESGDVYSTSTRGAVAAATTPDARIWKRLRIGGPIEESALALPLFGPPAKSLKDVRDQIESVGKDPRVEGVLIHFDAPSLGMAKVEELRLTIARLRDAKKKTVAIVTAADTTSYLLATGCDRIVMAPSGSLMMAGLSAEAFFFKNLFTSIGIEGDFLGVGKYKSAYENFTREDWSAPAREALAAVVDDLYEQMAGMIAAGRGLNAETVKRTIDLGPFTADDALRHNLVDQLAYEREFLESLEAERDIPLKVEDVEEKSTPQLESINPFSLLFGRPRTPARAGAGRSMKIALIYAVGPIMDIDPEGLLFAEQLITPKTLIPTLNECLDDPSIRAIVLRIDSPGGDATASDLIWKEIRRVKAQKPVIASMSDTAASGGYYIAMGADKIVAQPATITGSIGVFGGKLALGGLYQKIGVTTESITRGQNAGMFTTTRPFNETERAALQRALGAVYEDFVNKAAESRGMPVADIEALAQGRVWTGEAALEIGLVDEIGGLETAIMMAREMAGIPADRDVDLAVYPEPMTIMDMMQKILSGQAEAGAAATGLRQIELPPAMLQALPMALRQAVSIMPLLETGRPLALTPFLLEVR